MTLLLVAALGIVLGHWLGIGRPVFVIVAPASVGASAVHMAHRAGSDRFRTTGRRLSGQRRVAAAAALLVWGVAMWILTVHSQSIVPPAQRVASPEPATGADFSLRRGENFAGARDYDRAIADYDMALQLKPDSAEAYNDRGHAHYWRALRPQPLSSI